jgi:peptide-methionine (S)-S-oxide reductase
MGFIVPGYDRFGQSPGFVHWFQCSGLAVSPGILGTKHVLERTENDGTIKTVMRIIMSMKTRRIQLVLAGIVCGFLVFVIGCDEKQWQSIISTAKQSPTGGTTTMNTPANQTPESKPVESTAKREVAMFGAGCFWGVEATFRKVPGVLDTAVGYSGGHTQKPTYKQVCTDKTGHAEVIRIEFDPAKVSYKQLLEVFWSNHDPTTVNRQGPDVGTQYRSVVFFFSPEQEAAAKAMKAELTKAKRFRRPIVTQIEPAGPFWQAEEYHQRYLEKKGLDSCHL